MLAVNQLKEFKEGIFKFVNINEYHEDQGISSSGIKLILKSPKKYWYEYLSGLYAERDTKATLVGSALHLLLLEPEHFHQEYLILPQGLDRRTKEGKSIYEEQSIRGQNEGKKLIKAEDFNEINLMSESIRSNKAFQNLIKEKANIEDSLYWMDQSSKALLRARPDFYNDFLVVDIKTTESAAKDDFERSIMKYGYHIQAAMQLDGLSKLTGIEYKNFCHIAIEKEPPYLCAFYLLDQDAISLGRTQYKKGAAIYSECLKLDDWPGYDETIQTISLPDWYLKAQI